MFPCGLRVNGISVVFVCFIWLHAVEGSVCARGACACVCVRARACLQEKWGPQGALAAQASPSVSLPPLAPSALAEVVTRRQTAKRQNATPRATRNIVSQARLPLRRRNRLEQPGQTDRHTVPTHRPLRGRAPGSRCTHTHTYSVTRRPATHRTHARTCDLPLPTPPPSPAFHPLQTPACLPGVWGDGAGGARSDLGADHRMFNCSFGCVRVCVCAHPLLHSFPSPATSYPPSGPPQFPKSHGG